MQSVDLQPIAMRSRPDLRRCELGALLGGGADGFAGAGLIAVHDNVSGQYHRLRQDEDFVLRQLDGRTSLEQIRQRYNQRYAPRRVSIRALQSLIYRLHQNGLCVSNSTDAGRQTFIRGQRRSTEKRIAAGSNWLFIKFPGFNPTRLLNLLYPFVRPLLSRVGIALACVFCMLALVILLQRTDAFAAQMPTIQYWIAAENLWLVAIIIGGTKILHELGHGIACRHFGGRCRSIGFMLMVLVPALYCDTSDAWLIPQRYKRVLIGAAGMLVETLLAAIAVFIWASTNDDATRITALQVIVVCGVGTIILNANPLLRYDGYYILSDLWGVSNLSQTASATLKSEWMHRVWQQPLDVSISGVSTPQRLLLCVYAISAFLYRFLLLFTILWFVTQMLRPYGMQSAGILAVAMAGTTMIGTAIWRSAKKRSQSPRLLMRIAESAAPLIGHVSQRGKPVGMFRRLSVWLIAIGLVGLAFVPMPRRVQCDGKLIPEKETLMYAKTDGWMPQEPPTASLYKPITDDEVLMTLRNPDVVAEVAMASANLQSAELQLQTLTRRLLSRARAEPGVGVRRNQASRAANAEELPVLRAKVRAAKQQSDFQKSRDSGLTIRSNIDGRMLPPDVPFAPPRWLGESDAARLDSMTSDVFATINGGCWVASGTPIARCIRDVPMVELDVPQEEISHLSVGQDVKTLFHGFSDTPILGTVAAIQKQRDRQPTSNEQSTDAAQHHSGGRDLTGESSAAGSRPQTSVRYRVRITISDDSQERLRRAGIVYGMVGTAAVKVQHRSLFAWALAKAWQALRTV